MIHCSDECVLSTREATTEKKVKRQKKNRNRQADRAAGRRGKREIDEKGS